MNLYYPGILEPTAELLIQHKATKSLPSQRLLHLCDVEFDVGLQLQILVARGLNLVLDVLLEISHLKCVLALTLSRV